MNWLRRLFRLRERGLVKAYSINIPEEEREQFLADGWTEAADFRASYYRAVEGERVMLSKPRTLSEINVSSLVGQTITDFKTAYGTYGMGGPGFFGITLSDQPELHKVMVYAVWGASEYVLLDQHEITCHPRYYDMRHPWFSMFADEDILNWDDLTPVLVGCWIEQVELSERRLALHLRNGDGMTHLLEYLVNDVRLPRQGNGEARRDAFKAGVIADYVLFQHPQAVLWV